MSKPKIVMTPKIRVGKIEGNNVPNYPGYVSIIVKTKSDKVPKDGYSFPELSPYYLKCPIDELGCTGIMENIWQGSKIYPRVNEQKQMAIWDSKVSIWTHPTETHIDSKGNILPEYIKWRHKLMTNPLAVRYPNGYDGRHTCVASLLYNTETKSFESLQYIEARKRIYTKVYGNAAKETKEFEQLQTLLKAGKKLLILDVDGPKYTNKAPFNKVDKGSIAVNKENIQMLLNDTTQPFGHGYVLAVYLLGMDHLWLT